MKGRRVDDFTIYRADHIIQCVFLPLDPHQKEEVNKKAFEKFKKEHSAVPPTVDNAMPSERFEGEFLLTFQCKIS